MDREPPPIDLSNLSRDALEGLVSRLLVEVAALSETVAGLRDEIARLRRAGSSPDEGEGRRGLARRSRCQADRTAKLRPLVGRAGERSWGIDRTPP